MKTIRIDIPKEQLTRTYLVVWNGVFKLTEKELDILAIIVEKYMELKEAIKEEKYIYDLLFSTQVLREIRTKVGVSEGTLNNCKSSLKSKGLLTVDGDGDYRLDERVIPVKELVFKFNVDNGSSIPGN